MISSASRNGIAVTTGPKISSCTTFIFSFVFTSTVGFTKYPLLPTRLPPVTAFAHADIEIVAYAIELFFGNERAHLGIRVEAGADVDLLRRFRHAIDHFVE